MSDFGYIFEKLKVPVESEEKKIFFKRIHVYFLKKSTFPKIYL